MFKELKLQGLTEEQARTVMKELAESDANKEAAVAEVSDDDEPEDLLGCVRSWMKAQPEKIPDDALRDFNLKVRFQGHVDSTPPDHLRSMVRILVDEACI